MSRRILSNSNLKPIQAISIDAFSKFNSDNINQLSKIVSGSGDKDVVVNGLDVAGIGDTSFSFKSNNLIRDCNWTTESCNYNNEVFTFLKQENKTRYYDYAETTINHNNIPSSGIYSGYFEIKFDLVKGLPSNLVFNLNKHVIGIKKLDPFDIHNEETNDIHHYDLVFKYDFNFDESFIFRIGIFNDLSDGQVLNSDVVIENLSLRQIFDNNVLDYYTSEERYDGVFGNSVVHPLHKLRVSPGVAIKDNVTLNILKGNYNSELSAIELDVKNPNHWITSNKPNIQDFVKRCIKGQNILVRNDTEPYDWSFVDGETGKLNIFHPQGLDTNKQLVDDFTLNKSDSGLDITTATTNDKITTIYFNKSSLSQDDKWLLAVYNNKILGAIHNPYQTNKDYIDLDTDDLIDIDQSEIKLIRPISPIKVDGINYTRKVCLWAYVVVNYAYFKDPVPNISYIGLIKENDLFKTEYRDDYLIIAKLRFVDVDTFDIITYSDSRQWLGTITAEDVNYFVTCNNGEIWNDDVPVNVTDAIDRLRVKQINKLLKSKYKHDYDAEIDPAFNLRKEKESEITTSVNISEPQDSDTTDNHLERRIREDKNKIEIVDIYDPLLIESGLVNNSVFNLYGSFYLSSNNKWAVKSDFSVFGEYDSVTHSIIKQYLNFNTKGPFVFIDKDSKNDVIKFDFAFIKDDKYLYPTSPSNSDDIKHDSFLSYSSEDGSTENDKNNNKNHKHYLIFRDKYFKTGDLEELLDILPHNPESLINRRVLYGYKQNINGITKVRIKSSNHELDDKMMDEHLLTSLTQTDNHKLETSTRFVIDNNIKNNEFLLAKDISLNGDRSTVQITNSGVSHRNLDDDKIMISTDPDDGDTTIHMESSEYSIDDVFRRYWYKPNISFDSENNKLILTIDTEKNFIYRVTDLIKWLVDNGHQDYINKYSNLLNKKVFDIHVKIDATKSFNRSLDRNISDKKYYYEVIEKYFKSKFLLINDLDGTNSPEDGNDNSSYFNPYVSTTFSMFYRDKSGNVINVDNKDIWWKDDRRGYNNSLVTSTGDRIVSYDPENNPDEPFITSDGNTHSYSNLNPKIRPLYVFPSNDLNKINKTFATSLGISIDETSDNTSQHNAYSLARGNIRDTYAGAQTEYNFRYIKKFPESGTCETAEIDETIHDVLLATSDYYIVPNSVKITTPVEYDKLKMGWLFTTENGVISELFTPFIVGDYLQNLPLYEIPNTQSYSTDIDNINCTNQDGEPLFFSDVENETISTLSEHLRFHIFQGVDNRNNGCLSISNGNETIGRINPDISDKINNIEITREYSWILSYDGDTGIWRSQDMLGRMPFRLLTAKGITDNNGNVLSTQFDIKKIVSWKNEEDISQQCIIALSSDNLRDGLSRSTVQVIPFTSIFGTNSENIPDYLSSNESIFGSSTIVNKNGKWFGISKSSKKPESQPDEWLDHMLVQDISVAQVNGEDKIIYLGKTRKDKYRFPPSDINLECSDTPHHASILHNGIDPETSKPLVNIGFDICTTYDKNNNSCSITTPGMGKLNFDKQLPAQSTSSVIYTLHLDNGSSESYGNRFISVGSCNNYCTGIDWELGSYICQSSNPVSSTSTVDSIKDTFTFINPGNSNDTIHDNLPRYGIFKRVFEFNGVIYITTTNGILKIPNLTSTLDIKYISFESELKHTKWDDLPYNYKYSFVEKPIAWLTDQFIKDDAESAKNLTTAWIKAYDGVYGRVGNNFSIYVRDKWVYNDQVGNEVLKNGGLKSNDWLGKVTTTNDYVTTYKYSNRPYVSFDKFYNRFLVTDNSTDKLRIYKIDYKANSTGSFNVIRSIINMETGRSISSFQYDKNCIVYIVENYIYTYRCDNNGSITELIDSRNISSTIKCAYLFDRKLFILCGNGNCYIYFIKSTDYKFELKSDSTDKVITIELVDSVDDGYSNFSIIFDKVCISINGKIYLFNIIGDTIINNVYGPTINSKSISVENFWTGNGEISEIRTGYYPAGITNYPLLYKNNIARTNNRNSLYITNWLTGAESSETIALSGTNYPQVNSTNALREQYYTDKYQYRPACHTFKDYLSIYDECIDVFLHNVICYSSYTWSARKC